MACFPGLAQAENSEFQYEPDVPAVPNKENVPSDKDSDGSNQPSNPDADASGSNPEGGVGGGNGGSNTGGGANTGQGNQATGGGDGKAAGGDERAGGKLAGAKPIDSFDETAAPASDDGSSPLVPILIAIAVLAAISVGAFFYRQRRQDPTSSVSPKAS